MKDHPMWHASSYSSDQGGNCVEVATLVTGDRLMRDSKDRPGPALRFPTAAWAAFTEGVRSGQFG